MDEELIDVKVKFTYTDERILEIAKKIRPSDGVRANVMYRDPEPLREAAMLLEMLIEVRKERDKYVFMYEGLCK